MKTLRMGLYARVSSDRQAEERTIDSQVAALRARIAADGGHVEGELEFLDDGYSGGTLLRPALERLRDRRPRELSTGCTFTVRIAWHVILLTRSYYSMNSSVRAWRWCSSTTPSGIVPKAICSCKCRA